MQKENLLPGDFFDIWRKCKLYTAQIDNTLAKKLLELIKTRVEILLNNEALIASMFLDTRFLPFLNEKTSKQAKNILKRVWDNVNFFKSKKTLTEEKCEATENTAVEVRNN